VIHVQCTFEINDPEMLLISLMGYIVFHAWYCCVQTGECRSRVVIVQSVLRDIQ